ncbi:Galactose operon repressor, GalR-LacI family of transcriptional regulators [Klebsiella pneumoniae]|nr:Galactose operon repressor, GalR-LacI family of transcriptional regulators [Klebsiella pneumoniae IS53]CDL53659.1 Galactose operon repressor, GalR-LacI family of transcriptional regulators [Klebsiella pneumoniae ISC21]CDL57234.1 Galactose operon repressor, GalR-LacI family of transcriptional regulators [Klebsiella pneumoniae]
MATMLDVSIRAGVSKATVSRVLNGTGQVKESTRQQVFKAMEELGYRPNFLARSLANQTSNSIGLVVSTFDGFYFGRLLQQASRQTEAWGKQLIVTDGMIRRSAKRKRCRCSPTGSAMRSSSIPGT